MGVYVFIHLFGRERNISGYRSGGPDEKQMEKMEMS
jgi:hypothetical protein